MGNAKTTPNAIGDGLQALVELGFTSLEADVYAFLLGHSPATGYRIATGIGKPVANTYKAVASLADKGAIVIEEGESRLCRSVPPRELLGRLERDFRSRQKRAMRVLAHLPGAPADDRVYQMRSAEQVFERCRRMLSEAREIVLADLFPQTLEALRPDLERAAERGLRVAVKAYAPTTIEGVDLSVDPLGESTMARWPGQWVNLVVDGAQYLLAFLTADGRQVYQAVWSGSAYLSWVYHSAFGSEFALAALGQKLAAGAPIEDLTRWLTEHHARMGGEAPGYRALRERFDTSDFDGSSEENS